MQSEDQVASLRCTNLLVWSAVEHRSNTYAQDVLRRSSHVSDIFANAMRQCLRMLKQNPGATSAIGEIVAQAFSSIRNWMLLVRIACGCSDGKVLADTTKTEDVAREDRAFWTAIWPYYEKLLLASELDGQLTVCLPLAASSLTFVFVSCLPLLLIYPAARSRHLVVVRRPRDFPPPVRICTRPRLRL